MRLERPLNMPWRTRVRPVVSFLFFILAVAVMSGCGVVRSSTALIEARHEYDAARLAGAETRAPYEYTLGVEYLRKAKEEAGYSDYQVSERLARRAQAWLQEARRAAMVEGTTEEPVQGPDSRE